MPYQQVGNLWSVWPRFFAMLVVMLLLNILWAYASLYIHFVKAPANAPDEHMALAQATSETNALINWLLGMAFNAGLLVWSLRQRHVGESVATFIGMLWLTYVSFCFYYMIALGYSIAAVLQRISSKH